jgi:transposase InsO family protein
MAKVKRREQRDTRTRQERRPRHTEEDRQQVLEQLIQGKKRREVAEGIGVCTETVRLWWLKAQREGIVPKVSPSLLQDEKPEDQAITPGEKTSWQEDPPRNRTAPQDPAYGLSATEVEAILELKAQHPAMGPAQIRAQLKRFKGWRISVKAIGKTLQKNGYELEHRGSRPQGYEPQRFEAPYRNSLWQLDFMEVRLALGKRFILVVLDDFSRFLLAARILEAPTSEAVVETLEQNIRLHGKPEGVYTDRGGAFLAWRHESSFQRFCEHNQIDHHVSRAYHPQGRGKVEAVIRTIRQELWEVHHFSDEQEFRKELERFVLRYNFRRAHMGIDGLTPSDRYFGRWPEVLERINAVSRKRNDAPELSRSCSLIEEHVVDSPVEVVRLMVHEGKLELRLFGHKVVLGELQK